MSDGAQNNSLLVITSFVHHDSPSPTCPALAPPPFSTYQRIQIAYLDKLITLVGTSLNTLVDARPAKIVAGLEAENTNRMLQLLALAAKERPDSTRYSGSTVRVVEAKRPLAAAPLVI